MAVYVDNFYLTGITFGRMKMCHMIADTREELLTMADAIGVQRRWIQSFDTPREHFDICLSKRAKAVKLGAIEIDMRVLAEKTRIRTYEGKQRIY
jgi:hypothetical protein